MATFTEHFTLAKPDEDDYYNIEDFNGNMDILDDHLAEFDDKLENMDSSISTLSAKVNTLDDAVGDSSGLDSLETKVDTIDTTVNSIETKVDSVDTKASTIDTKVNTLTTNLSTVSTKVSTIDTSVSSLKTDISSLNNYVNGSSSGDSLAEELKKFISNPIMVASDTRVLEKIGLEVAPIMSATGSYNTFKLFDFVAPYTGSLRFYLGYTIIGTASTNIVIKCFTPSFKFVRDIPNFSCGSYLTDNYIYLDPEDKMQLVKTSATIGINECSIDMPVIAGQLITFVASYDVCPTQFTIEELYVGYDIVDSEEIIKSNSWD